MYLIKILDGKSASWVQAALEKLVEKDGRFYLRQTKADHDTLNVGRVRLTTSKPYCGQHPGECFVGPKRKGKWLEWDDWVAFHSIVNDVLDDLGVSADVTTRPAESIDKPPRGSGLKSRFFYIRRGLNRRLRYEWRESSSFGGRPLRIWNPGTNDQFEVRHA